jgi:hypothetical protein
MLPARRTGGREPVPSRKGHLTWRINSPLEGILAATT